MGNAAEFMLEPGSRPVFVVQPYGQNYGALIAKLQKEPGVQVVECDSLMEAANIARRLPGALILSHATAPNDLIQVINIMKSCAEPIKRKTLRIVLTIKFKADAIVEKIQKMGCAEIIHEPLADRTFLFKMDRHLKAVPVAKSTAPEAAGAQAVKPGAAAAQASQAQNDARRGIAARGAANRVEWIDPLKIASDCFTRCSDEPKKFAGRWVFKLNGPTPNIGKWLKAEGSGTGAGNLAWVWKTNDASGPDGKDPFISEEGQWVFKGNRPEFQTDSWMFVGTKPELSFVKGSETLATKVKLDPAQGFLIARDSDAGKKHFLKIRELLDVLLKSKGDKDKKSGYGSGTGGEDDGPSDSDAQIEMLDPLALKSDCWLLQNREARRVAGRWLIRLTGPGPVAARWDPVKVEGSAEEFWQFVPLEKQNPFVTDPGHWIFRGNQPRFLDDGWNFAGKKPELSFRHEGKIVVARMRSDDGKKLGITRDSPQATAMLPAIQASIEKTLNTLSDKKKEEEAESVVGTKKAAGAKGDDANVDGGDEDESADYESATSNDSGKVGRRSLRADKNADEDLLGAQDSDSEQDNRDDGDPDADFDDDEESLFASDGRKRRSNEDVGSADGLQKKKKKRKRSADAQASDSAGDDDDSLDAKESENADEDELIGTSKRARKREGEVESESDESGAPGQIDSKGSKSRKRSSGLGDADDTEDSDDSDDAEGDGPSADGAPSKKRERAAKGKGEDAGLDEPGYGKRSPLSPSEAPSQKKKPRNSSAKEDTSSDESDDESTDQTSASDETDELGTKRRSEGEEPDEAYGIKSGAEKEKRAWNQPRREGAGDPATPLMSPVAIGFLMSELSSKRDRELRDVARKFCAYLSASLSELRVELWSRGKGSSGWEFVASQDSSDAKLAAGLTGVAPKAAAITPEIISVLVTSAAGGAVGMPGADSGIGVILVGGTPEDIARVPFAHLEACAEMCRGLLKSCIETDVAKAA